MKAWTKVPTTIDEYIAAFSGDVQPLLRSVRSAISAAAPDATECISYQIPTYKLHGNLVHFAAYKNHIGFYPGAAAIVKFEQALRDYQTSKGTVQFPLDQPLPLDLIRTIVAFRVQSNLENASIKRKPTARQRSIT